MKVFLSWSGTRSQAVANLLNDWLCCVIQAARPWISTRDLDRGSLWFGEINDQLKDTSVGIICLTQENKERPWILFEAGALAKGLSTSRVCTFLIDLESRDIGDPLAQFNHTFPTKSSISGLVKTLNSTLGANGLDGRVLEQVFITYWPQFEEKFNQILLSTESPVPPKPRAGEEILDEILENTRALSSKIRRLEAELERESPRKQLDQSEILEHNELKYLIDTGAPIEVIIALCDDKIPKDTLDKLLKNRGAVTNFNWEIPPKLRSRRGEG